MRLERSQRIIRHFYELYQKYYGDTSAMGLAFTREEIEYIRAQKQVNMAFINNRPPFSMENDDGEIEVDHC